VGGTWKCFKFFFFSQEIVSSSNNSIDSDTVPRTIESVYIKEESIQSETDDEVRSCCGVFLDQHFHNFYKNKKNFCKGNGEVVCMYVMKAYGGVEIQLLILNLSSRSR